MLMLQSLKRALKLNVDADDARLYFCVCRFQHFIEKNSSAMAQPVKEVINVEAKNILSIKTAQARNEQFMQNNASSLEHRFIGNFISDLLQRRWLKLQLLFY